MRYTVKQLADVAGVSVRTLHYYDQIGLLSASVVGQNGYRYYTEDAVLRLQQIMFYRELDFPLAEIQAILDEPDFDLVVALQSHKRVLQQRLGRLSNLIHTIDRTVLHLKGARKMETYDLFEGFDEARQEQYEQEVSQLYGDAKVKESRQRWQSYSAEQKARIQAEGGAIYRELAELIGVDPASAEVQQLIARWHEHIRAFYEPTPEILLSLGNMYAEHPDFAAFYQRLHPELPEFLRQAIVYYCRSAADNAPVVNEDLAGEGLIDEDLVVDLLDEMSSK
jgi:DNA-binding transcriptional MerR regulator